MAHTCVELATMAHSLKKLEIYIQMAAEDAPCGEVHKLFGEQPMGTELVSRTCYIQVVIATQT